MIGHIEVQGDKFVLTVNGQVIGRSKHHDYFSFHQRRGDVKALRIPGLTFTYSPEAAAAVEKSKPLTVKLEDKELVQAFAAYMQRNGKGRSASEVVAHALKAQLFRKR